MRGCLLSFAEKASLGLGLACTRLPTAFPQHGILFGSFREEAVEAPSSGQLWNAAEHSRVYDLQRVRGISVRTERGLNLFRHRKYELGRHPGNTVCEAGDGQTDTAMLSGRGRRERGASTAAAVRRPHSSRSFGSNAGNHRRRFGGAHGANAAMPVKAAGFAAPLPRWRKHHFITPTTGRLRLWTHCLVHEGRRCDDLASAGQRFGVQKRT
jgi:hypothetical protein